jgi:hypothetical protein
MKAFLFIFLSVLLIYTCNFQNAAGKVSPAKIDEEMISRIDFEKEIKPILIKNCSPCHFPGGKMYGRLPFDKDTTIVNHSISVLKRIKNEEENALIREFVAENKSGLPEDKPH